MDKGLAGLCMGRARCSRDISILISGRDGLDMGQLFLKIKLSLANGDYSLLIIDVL